MLTEHSSKTLAGFAPEAMEFLVKAFWPGNGRQLLNVTNWILNTLAVVKAQPQSSSSWHSLHARDYGNASYKYR
ncbi:MAG TPA: hypothetical protein EYN73_07685 [Chromatiaceae bacterium]|nr:hypothetical protein [Chromatiaceae bacterium]